MGRSSMRMRAGRGCAASLTACKGRARVGHALNGKAAGGVGNDWITYGERPHISGDTCDAAGAFQAKLPVPCFGVGQYRGESLPSTLKT